MITKSITIKKDCITYQAVRASGPGGQNVNKVSTAIILRYPLELDLYPLWFIYQLKSNAGSQLSKEGVITIKAQSFRSQKKNKEDALGRLIALFNKSGVKPKPRIKTKPPKRSKEDRLFNKRKKSEKKKMRKQPNLDD